MIVVCLLVPEGMAYAQIAGMPPQTAVYVAPPALLLYAIFASSRKLVVVVSATQAALSAGAVAALATAGTPHYEELTAALPSSSARSRWSQGCFASVWWLGSSHPPSSSAS